MAGWERRKQATIPLSPIQLDALAPPVSSHMPMHQRLQPRRLQGAFRTGTTCLHMRQRALKHVSTSSPTALFTPPSARPSSPPSDSKAPPLPTSLATLVQQRQLYASLPTPAGLTCSIARPRRIPFLSPFWLDSPHPFLPKIPL